MAHSAWKISHDLAQAAADQFRAECPSLASWLSQRAWRTLQLRLGCDLRRILEPGGLAADFPVALRLASQLSEHWRHFVRGFLENWAHDAPDLGRMIDGAGSQISAFGHQTSDPHDGGKRVLVLKFSGQRRLVYKPRSLGCELVFNQLLAELNAAGFPWPLRTVTVLDHEDHGWMEYVEPRACNGHRQIESFYLRAGALICLFHALSGVDGHAENLVPAGPQPVLVDLETLLHPPTSDSSIFRTGLLPVPGRPHYGIAAFQIHRPAAPNRFVREMERGFLTMCDFLEGTIDLPSWVEKLAQQPRRKLLRSTDKYLHFQHRLLCRELLASEKKWAEAIEQFVHPASHDEQKAERAGLQALDIPRLPVTGFFPTPLPGALREQARLLHDAF